MRHTLALAFTTISSIILPAIINGCAAPPEADDDHLPARATKWTFDETVPGQIPVGWVIDETNPTEALAEWSVIADESAPSSPNAMALTASRNYDGTYNLAIAENTSYRDLDLTVMVQAVTGIEDQGGGPIWRCLDKDNYYICRFNPLESNHRVYCVKDGRRRQLDSARIELKAGRWYELRVVMIGPDITCYLDGERLLEVTDDTFTEAGNVGLWTKADAVTRFDDLTVRPAASEPHRGG
ncbi:MAG: hypothetical protein SYC29_10505 [Planctomycetota bacterium]|nr:hypothetical protein [Planctomycetota bacterium]